MARGSFSAANYLQASASVSAYPFSIACWMYTATGNLANSRAAAIGETGSQVGCRLQVLGADDYLRARTYDGVSNLDATSTASFTAGWNHGAVIFASAASRTVYLNGGNSATETTEAQAIAFEQTTIGGDNALADTWDSNLAEFAVWNRVLTADEAAALADGFSPLFLPNGLVSYVPMVRGDSSGNEPDIARGVSFTETGSVTVADHPRIIYPSKAIWTPYTTGAAPEGLSIPVAIHNYRRRRVAV